MARPTNRLKGWKILVAGMLLTLLGCSGRKPPGGDFDVLVLVVDCMRADHLASYGYERETTPTIDALAQEGVRFNRAYAQSNWTKPAVASLFTGLYVRHHGLTVGTNHYTRDGEHHRIEKAKGTFPLPPDLATLATAFQDRGYRTAGFVENSHIVAAQGFGRGFEVYERSRTAGLSMASWLQELELQGRFFGYVHVIGPHDPYDSKRGDFRKRYRGMFGMYASDIDWSGREYRQREDFTEDDLRQARAHYDSELRYFDQEQLAPLVETLRQLGRYEETLIVATADHGEELFDHGGWGHGRTLFEEVVRVPLVLKLPKSLEGLAPGSVVEEIVEHVDLFPTLKDLAGLRVREKLDGQSLASLLRGRRGEDPNAFAISEFGAGVTFQVLASAVIHRDRKWVERYPLPYGQQLRGLPGHQGLFDLPSDQLLEEPDLEEARELRGILWRAVSDSPKIRRPLPELVQHSEEEIEQLKALGYID